VSIGLALVAALVFGDHVVRGGFIWDDWENAGTTRYSYEPGFLGPFDLRQMAYRPVLQLLIPLPHLLFGSNPAPHLLLALAIAVGAGAAFHALLRACGAGRGFALAAALLALVFPWSTSTRLWATASLNLVAVALFCAAGALSLRALAGQSSGRRASVAITAAMLAAAVLTYEAVVGVVALLPLLYRLRAVSWRPVLRRWRWEALAAAAAALLVALATTKRESGGGAAFEHALTIARQGMTLTGRALAPLDAIPPLAAVAGALVLAAAVAALRRPGARRSLLGAGLALAALALSWLPFVPGEAKYVPDAPGIYDRVNIVAGFALAALVCSLAAGVRTLLPSRRDIALPAVALLAGLVAAGWVLRDRDEVQAYDRSAQAQDSDLAALGRALPVTPRPGTVVVLFHRRSAVAPGVPAFGQPWDFSPALKLRYDDPSLSGFPVDSAARVSCGAAALHVTPSGGTAPPSAPYARAVLVDAATGRGARVSSARGCRSAVAELRPRRGSA
jgi:hypothetical protein